MGPQQIRPQPFRPQRLGLILYILYASLLITYLLSFNGAEQKGAWWVTPLLSAPFLLALLLHDWPRPTNLESRLRTRNWHDPRMHSAQER